MEAPIEDGQMAPVAVVDDARAPPDQRLVSLRVALLVFLGDPGLALDRGATADHYTAGDTDATRNAHVVAVALKQVRQELPHS